MASLLTSRVCRSLRQGGRRARGSPRLSVITQPAPRPMIETSTDHRSCGPEIFINLPAQIYHLVARSSTGPISQFRPELSPHTPAGSAEGVRLRSSLDRLPGRVRWKYSTRYASSVTAWQMKVHSALILSQLGRWKFTVCFFCHGDGV